MIHPDCAAMINAHLPLELKASHAYLRMALEANARGFFGVEKFFQAASLEEQGHLRKLIGFINDYDMANSIPAIDEMPQGTTDIRSMFVAALGMEQAVSASFNAILNCADDECKDFQTVAFILPMQADQTDSEIEIRDILNYLDNVAVGNLAEFDEYVGDLVK